MFECGGRRAQGLEELIVRSAADIYALLDRGSAKRRTAETLLNKQSSRSHSVFCVTARAPAPGPGLASPAAPLAVCVPIASACPCRADRARPHCASPHAGADAPPHRPAAAGAPAAAPAPA
jgi:hypothetical protein